MLESSSKSHPKRPKKRKKKKAKVFSTPYGVGFGLGFNYDSSNDSGSIDVGGGDMGGGMGESIMEGVKSDGSKYEFSCAMLNLSSNNSAILNHWTKKTIPEDCLYIDKESGINGYQDQKYHVTAKYGIIDAKPTKLEKLVKDFGVVELEFKNVTVFDNNPDFDVLKVDVGGESLIKLNKLISENIENQDKFKDYTPHITLAFIKKNKFKKIPNLKNSDFFVGLSDKCEQIYFNSKNGKDYYIDLC